MLGDALDAARLLAPEIEGRVRLVYVDPPYMSQASYVHEARLDGRADGRVRRATAYADSWSGASYLDMLAPRVEALARLLHPEGSIWVHVDWRASYLVRVLLDEILGPDRFLNEIVWRRAPNLGRQAASGQFGRTLDTIVVYGGPRARLVPPTRLEPVPASAIRWDAEGRPSTLAPRGDYTDASVARLEREGRIHRTASGKVYVKYFLVQDGAGRWCRERRVDALWTDIPPLRHAAVSERTGFPTQKPRALLERVIACATDPGDLVVDMFCGSGTTAEAAHVLGRRAVIADRAPLAFANARARLARAGAGLVMERCGVDVPPALDEPFEVEVRSSDGPTEISLVTPRDPLAWAIDPAYDPERGFCTAWHAERTPGVRPTPVSTCARLAERPRGPLALRVWGDDGARHEIVVGRAALAKKRLTVRAREGRGA